MELPHDRLGNQLYGKYTIHTAFVYDTVIILSQLVGMIDFVHHRVGSAALDSWDIVCKSHDFGQAVRHDTALKIFLAGELPVSLWWGYVLRSPDDVHRFRMIQAPLMFDDMCMMIVKNCQDLYVNMGIRNRSVNVNMYSTYIYYIHMCIYIYTHIGMLP